MTTPVPPLTEPDKSAQFCPPSLIGPCSTCQRPTHKYGTGALSPLCEYCDAKAMAKWGKPLRAARVT